MPDIGIDISSFQSSVEFIIKQIEHANAISESNYYLASCFVDASHDRGGSVAPVKPKTLLERIALHWHAHSCAIEQLEVSKQTLAEAERKFLNQTENFPELQQCIREIFARLKKNQLITAVCIHAQEKQRWSAGALMVSLFVALPVFGCGRLTSRWLKVACLSGVIASGGRLYLTKRNKSHYAARLDRKITVRPVISGTLRIELLQQWALEIKACCNSLKTTGNKINELLNSWSLFLDPVPPMPTPRTVDLRSEEEVILDQFLCAFTQDTCQAHAEQYYHQLLDQLEVKGNSFYEALLQNLSQLSGKVTSAESDLAIIQEALDELAFLDSPALNEEKLDNFKNLQEWIQGLKMMRSSLQEEREKLKATVEIKQYLEDLIASLMSEKSVERLEALVKEAYDKLEEESIPRHIVDSQLPDTLREVMNQAKARCLQMREEIEKARQDAEKAVNDARHTLGTTAPFDPDQKLKAWNERLLSIRFLGKAEALAALLTLSQDVNLSANNMKFKQAGKANEWRTLVVQIDALQKQLSSS